MAKQNETITAQYLAESAGLDLDRVFTVANMYGMNAKRLYPDDVLRIRRELASRRKISRTLEDRGNEPVLNMKSLSERGDLIVRIESTRENVSRYMFASDLLNLGKQGEDPFANDYSFDSFIEQINVPAETEHKKRKRPEDGKGGKGKHGGDKTHRRPYVTMDPKVFDFLISKQEEYGLRALLHEGQDEYPEDITHATVLLRDLVGDDTVGALKIAGYKINAFTPQAIMTKARAIKKRRINTEVAHYFKDGHGAFIDSAEQRGFDFKNWRYDDSVRQVVSWLEANADIPERGMPFLVNCLKFRIGKEITSGFDAKRTENLFEAWFMGASQYEFIRGHPAYRQYLKQGAVKFDDLAIDIVKRFAGKKGYKGRDAVRLMGGLYVAGKAEPSEQPRRNRRIEFGSSEFQNAERIGNSVDYLLCRYGEISKIVSDVIQRIKEGELRQDDVVQNKTLYNGIQKREFAVDGREQARYLARAVRSQLSVAEKALFQRRLTHRSESLSPHEIDRILGFYIENEGQKVLGYSAKKS